jgi:hypothetical protein
MLVSPLFLLYLMIKKNCKGSPMAINEQFLSLLIVLPTYYFADIAVELVKGESAN